MTGGLFLCLTISILEIVVVTKSVITTILVPHHLNQWRAFLMQKNKTYFIKKYLDKYLFMIYTEFTVKKGSL